MDLGFPVRRLERTRVECLGFNSFGDEKATSYEIGTRTELFDRRLRLNVTLFRAEYTDLQINTAYTPPGQSLTVFVTGNSGDAYDQGIELESQFVLSPDLTGHLAMGFQHSEYTGLASSAIVSSGFTIGGPLWYAPRDRFPVARCTPVTSTRCMDDCRCHRISNIYPRSTPTYSVRRVQPSIFLRPIAISPMLRATRGWSSHSSAGTVRRISTSSTPRGPAAVLWEKSPNMAFESGISYKKNRFKDQRLPIDTGGY